MSGERRGVRQAEALRQRLGLSYEHVVGLRFAINVFIATTIVWFTLHRIGDSNPIWAIASMIAASDPEPTEARRMFRSRLINVLVGCAVGLVFLLLNRESHWMIPLALAVTVLISTWAVRIKTMWRQAPITSKNYGQAFLDSLPEVKEYRSSLSNLPQIAESWIDFGGR